MLSYLETRDVGPAAHLELELAPRVNLLTGDNGLGKTFLLDIAWWVATRTWSAQPAWPKRGEGSQPQIKSEFAATGSPSWSYFHFPSQKWEYRTSSRAGTEYGLSNPGIALYARVDGGFSVWDPFRNSSRDTDAVHTIENAPPAYHFNAEAVWDGLEVEDSILCNGLIRDLEIWRLHQGPSHEILVEILKGLSPHRDEELCLGDPMRVSVRDARDIPALELSYGKVPVTHASAGMRRIIALAYLMVWAWTEHRESATLLNAKPLKRMLLILDEIESHLHPQWQRVLLPSLLEVTRHLQPELEVQIIATTHSPMVLASAEPEFDSQRDALFVFDLENGEVSLNKADWRPRGDATGWLTSEVFALEEARSLPAERAIRKAKEAMRRPDVSLDEMRRIHHELHGVLKELDPFWPRWLATAKAAGVEP